MTEPRNKDQAIAGPAEGSSAADRAAHLVAQMTLEEKVSQMVHNAVAIERLDIPAYNWWNECLHGVARAGIATVFPQAIALAATFDSISSVGWRPRSPTRPARSIMTSSGAALRSMYAGLTFWSPNVNIFRDPRWGRGQETYGEDPYLAVAHGRDLRTRSSGRDDS